MQSARLMLLDIGSYIMQTSPVGGELWRAADVSGSVTEIGAVAFRKGSGMPSFDSTATVTTGDTASAPFHTLEFAYKLVACTIADTTTRLVGPRNAITASPIDDGNTTDTTPMLARAPVTGKQDTFPANAPTSPLKRGRADTTATPNVNESEVTTVRHSPGSSVRA